jgi:ParB family chromosome partitioning protein
MLPIRKRGLFESSRVVYLRVEDVRTPAAPRKPHDSEAMRELVGSVTKYGVLQPLTVRRADGGFELISGERRLRAAQLAGLSEVPCIVLAVGEEQSAALALAENLQHRGMDYVEEARALRRLITQFGYSQEQAAQAVGLTQPAVANKLRLLRLEPALLELARDLGLTERHARALLRLETDSERETALTAIAREGMNVARADAYIDALAAGIDPNPPPEPEPPPKRAHITFAIRDVRFFLNTLERAADIMRQSGTHIEITREDMAGEIRVTVRIATGGENTS